MQCSKQRCFQHSENGAVLRQERLSPKMICRPTQCPNYSFFPMLSSCHLPSSSHLHRHFSTLVHCVSPTHQTNLFPFSIFLSSLSRSNDPFLRNFSLKSVFGIRALQKVNIWPRRFSAVFITT